MPTNTKTTTELLNEDKITVNKIPKDVGFYYNRPKTKGTNQKVERGYG